MKKQKTEKKNITRWHIILGGMLEELLTSVKITVKTDFHIMSTPPKADILLLRRNTRGWTKEQLMRLPDGIRDTKADHILIEFKYTESVNKAAIAQTLAYDTFYKRVNQNLDIKRIQTFILSSATPRELIKNKAGYNQQIKQGVFKSSNFMLEQIQLISINELSDEPHNQYIKCFASRKKEKERAFTELMQSGKAVLTSELYYIITGLWNILFKTDKGEIIMEHEITPFDVSEAGRKMHELLIARLKPEDFLARFEPEDILSQFKPEDILSQFKPEERLNGLKPEERLNGLKPEERLNGLKPEERLNGLKPEEIISTLSTEDIEKLLNKRKREKGKK